MRPPSATPNSKRKHSQITYGRSHRPFRPPPNDMFHPPTSAIDQTPPKIPPRPPQVPQSQREATMAVQPSSENIEQFQAVTGADYATAVRYIKAKRNDVSNAINALLDGDDLTKDEESMTWNEDLLHAGRDGESMGDAPDRLLRPLGAPTAPNTRSNSPHPTTKAEEDAQMEQAMQNSMEGTGAGVGIGLRGQETGSVGMDGKEVTFGPANKEYYDASQWAMVPTSLSASEVVPDVDVEGRKNGPGEPRFIKPLAVDGDYLPNLLTICHGIAGVREAMLMRDSVRSMYGEDSKWWKGHKISMPKIVHTDGGQPADANAEAYDELQTEVQRLIAFLDKSDRSYASASGLMELDALKDKDPDPSATSLSTFLGEWVQAAAAAKINVDRTELDAFRMFKTKRWGEELDLGVVDLKCETQAPEGETAELSEMLDDAVWGSDAQSMNARDRNVDQPAEVLVIRLKHADKAVKQLRVSVPAEFCMDKYLKENTEATMAVREQVAKGKTRMKKLDEVEKKLTSWKHPKKNEQMDARQLLKHTHRVFSGQNKHDAESNGLPNGVPADENTPPHYQEIAQKLEKAMASIDDKLIKLASEKEKTRKAIAEMSRNPLPELEGQLKHHYTLRGVATKPSTTYVLLPKDEPDEDTTTAPAIDDGDDQEMLLEHQDDEDTPEGMQWWRIEYEVNAAGNGANVSKIKMDGQTVLRAAELEHGSALLVYASDGINDIALHDPSLPPALREFVERDNELFAAELREAAERMQTAPPAYEYGDGNDVPRQSIEPRGSMDSTRAQHDVEEQGQSPLGYGHDGFMEHPGFGMGPGTIKQGQYDDAGEPEDAGPVHEIKLDEPSEDVVMDGDGDGSGKEMEMLQSHPSLIPGVGVNAGGGGDTAMEDVGATQDDGVGGAMHVEDAGGNMH